MPAKNDFRKFILMMLGICEQRRKKAARDKAFAKACSWCDYVSATCDPVQAFDEALFAIRACNYFVTEHPNLAENSVKQFLGMPYKMLKDAAREIKAGCAGEIALSEARAIIAAECEREIYLRLNYQNKMVFIHELLDENAPTS